MTRIFLLASLLFVLAVPTAAQSEPVVGTKFSIASGWMGGIGASDGTNFLAQLESDKTAAKVAAQLISSSGAKIGSTIALGTDGQSCCVAGAAFDGTNYLVTWEADQGIKDGSSQLVYGQFINTSGAKVGQAIAMTTAGIWYDGINMLAYGGGKYLLTYTRLISPSIGDNSSTNRYVAGRIITPDGFMGSEFRISTGYGNSSSLAFDGTNFFVVWKEDSHDYEVRGRFVSPSGNLGQEISINASLDPSDNPVSVAFDGTNYLVAWNDEVGGDTKEFDIFGQRVSPGGVLLGNVIPIVNTTGGQVIPSLNFDGTNFVAVWADAKNDTNHNNSCDAGEGTCWDISGRYIGKDGALASSIFTINADAGNQMGGVLCAGGKCLAFIDSGFVLGSGGPSQVGEVYGAFVTFQTPDTSLPTVPAGLAAAAISTTQVNLTWTASTDNVGVTGYKVYRGGTLVGSPTTNSYSDTGLTASTSYSYTVAACDAANNCSAQSSAVSATTSSGTAALTFATGWNLVGNSVQATIYVADYFNDANKVASIWKWIVTGTSPGVAYPTWAYYSPGGDRGQAFAISKGYELLTSINAGEGFWLKANSPFTMQLPAASSVASSSFQNLSSGWHLLSTGDADTPSTFNTNLSVTQPATGGVPSNMKSLWVWDNAQSNWYFYAPGLDAKGGTALTDFIANNGYLNFTAASKTLGAGIGFWVNK